MKELTLLAGVAVLLVAAGTARSVAPPTSEPIGIWAVPARQVKEYTSKVPPSRWTHIPWPFRYEGRSVTLFLLALPGEEPEECMCRMKARWEGNVLCWLSPAGRRIPIARFVQGRFVIEQDGVVWTLEKAN
jgi:hypothetical protein